LYFSNSGWVIIFAGRPEMARTDKVTKNYTGLLQKNGKEQAEVFALPVDMIRGKPIPAQAYSGPTS
jgi:hypothetical protein